MAVKLRFTIPKEFFDFEEDQKYAGDYVLERMKGWRRLEVDKECRTIDVESKTAEFDDAKWSLRVLQESLKKPKFTIEELNDMPPGLLDFLIEKAIALNTISKEKRDFLSSLSFTKSRQSKP